MYKNIAVALQIVERARREGRSPARTLERARAKPIPAPSIKLGPMQKIVAFGPLT